ncbi:MAG TPA: hypothetical protein VH561_04655 [Micromonosporaceae bacterium]
MSNRHLHCPTPGCTPVLVDLNRSARRRLARAHRPNNGQMLAHSDHCPYAGPNTTPGWQAVGRVRSPFRGGDDG